MAASEYNLNDFCSNHQFSPKSIVQGSDVLYTGLARIKPEFKGGSN